MEDNPDSGKERRMTCHAKINPQPLQRCEACSAPLSRGALALMKLSFTPEQKAAGGKRLQCSSCGRPLWLDLAGNVTAAGGCGDDIRDLLDTL